MRARWAAARRAGSREGDVHAALGEDSERGGDQVVRLAVRRQHPGQVLAGGRGIPPEQGGRGGVSEGAAQAVRQVVQADAEIAAGPLTASPSARWSPGSSVMCRPSSSYAWPAARSSCLSRQPRSRTSSSRVSRRRASRPAQAPGPAGGPASHCPRPGRAYPGTGTRSPSSSGSIRSVPREGGRRVRTVGRSSRPVRGLPRSSPISSQASSRSRARRVPVVNACRSRSLGAEPP